MNNVSVAFVSGINVRASDNKLEQRFGGIHKSSVFRRIDAFSEFFRKSKVAKYYEASRYRKYVQKKAPKSPEFKRILCNFNKCQPERFRPYLFDKVDFHEPIDISQINLPFHLLFRVPVILHRSYNI